MRVKKEFAPMTLIIDNEVEAKALRRIIEFYIHKSQPYFWQDSTKMSQSLEYKLANQLYDDL